MKDTARSVALIATGDEITEGDILNSTGPAIARQLAEYGFFIKQHRLIPDDEQAIEQAIRELLLDHHYLFITGGLGPTSDDRTRFALANALDTSLVFDDASWQHIVQRVQQFTQHIPNSNKQQALFPQTAQILINHHGTANGCFIQQQQKSIFMLPGPPTECMPMFTDYVVPQLPLQQRYKLSYLLLGVSESGVAEKIDNALYSLGCRSGYRAESPYVECKVWADNQALLAQCDAHLRRLLSAHLVSTEQIPADLQLVQQLQQHSDILHIYDSATNGSLQNAISFPETIDKLRFVHQAESADIIITGLDAFWQNQAVDAELTIHFRQSQQTLSHNVRRRKPAQTKHYSVHWLCWKIRQWLYKDKGANAPCC